MKKSSFSFGFLETNEILNEIRCTFCVFITERYRSCATAIFVMNLNVHKILKIILKCDYYLNRLRRFINQNVFQELIATY
jgi:hypothetical protein